MMGLFNFDESTDLCKNLVMLVGLVIESVAVWLLNFYELSISVFVSDWLNKF